MEKTSELTRNEERLLELFKNTTDEGKLVVWKALVCAAVFGEEMFDEAKVYVENGDSDNIRAVIEKYYQKLEKTKKQDGLYIVLDFGFSNRCRDGNIKTYKLINK